MERNSFANPSENYRSSAENTTVTARSLRRVLKRWRIHQIISREKASLRTQLHLTATSAKEEESVREQGKTK
jgi:hypothetical protein